MAEEEPPLYEDGSEFLQEVEDYIYSFNESASFETTLLKINKLQGQECYIYTIKNISSGDILSGENYVLKAFFNKDDYEHELRMTGLFWKSSSDECAPYFNMMLKDDIPGTSPETTHNKPRFSIIMNFFSGLATVQKGTLDIKNLDHLFLINKLLWNEKYYYNILKNFIICLRDLNKKKIFHRDLKYDNIIFVKWSKIDQEIEKGIHLIDYGSALELKEILGLEDKGGSEVTVLQLFLSEGLTPQNIFPLYVFLEIFGKEEKFHETCSYILQAHEIWTFILTLFYIMNKTNKRVADDGKKRSDIQLLNYKEGIPELVSKWDSIKHFSEAANFKMPRQIYNILMSYAIDKVNTDSMANELEFIFPKEVFNSSNLEVFSKEDGKLFNPHTDITQENADPVQQKVMKFCMAYVKWFDDNLDTILMGMLGRVLKPQPVRKKGNLKKTKRKKSKRKKTKRKKSKKNKRKKKKTKKKPKKTKRKRRR
jgi:serine/threonine protein kinase